MSRSPAEPVRLEAVLDLVAEGVAVFDAAGELVMANPAFWRICGVDPATSSRRLVAPGWRVVDEHGEPLPPERWPASEALREGRPVVARRLGLHRPDGSFVWLSVSATPSPDGPGGPEAIVSLADVSAEQTAREALRAGRDLFRDVIDGISDSVAFRDREGRYRAVNQAFCEASGVAREDLLGRTADEVVAPEWRGEAAEAFARMAASPGPFTSEVAEPSGRIWRVARRPHLGADGAFAGVVAIATEVTEYRALQAELMDANAELERRVGARTRELERAVAELEAFSYRVSHDLRAPLRAIRELARDLARELGPGATPEVADRLRSIDGAVEGMGALVSALLDLSQVGRRAVVLDIDPVDRGALAAEAARELAAPARERGVTITVGEMPTWPVDARLLRQVLVNLISNAVKFSRPGGGAVRVTAAPWAREVVVAVEDEGVGFALGDASRLFGPFERLPNAAGVEGAGIGLAIVQRIVAAHGGRVWAAGAPGEGARFSFSLPPWDS